MDWLDVAFLVVVCGGAFVFAPLAVIWALNTMFHLGLPYNVQTWAAAMILMSAVSIPYRRRK